MMLLTDRTTETVLESSHSRGATGAPTPPRRHDIEKRAQPTLLHLAEIGQQRTSSLALYLTLCCSQRMRSPLGPGIDILPHAPPTYVGSAQNCCTSIEASWSIEQWGGWRLGRSYSQSNQSAYRPICIQHIGCAIHAGIVQSEPRSTTLGRLMHRHHGVSRVLKMCPVFSSGSGTPIQIVDFVIVPYAFSNQQF
jgi:hypothetical protein